MENIAPHHQLRILQLDSGQNQDAFAESIGLSQSAFSEIITGKRKPALDTAARIERKLGIMAASWVAE